MPKKIDPELRARAVRLVREHQQEYASLTAVANQLEMARESVRRWVTQAEVDAGDRPGLSSAENEEIKRLKAENSTGPSPSPPATRSSPSPTPSPTS